MLWVTLFSCLKQLSNSFKRGSLKNCRRLNEGIPTISQFPWMRELLIRCRIPLHGGGGGQLDCSSPRTTSQHLTLRLFVHLDVELKVRSFDNIRNLNYSFRKILASAVVGLRLLTKALQKHPPIAHAKLKPGLLVYATLKLRFIDHALTKSRVFTSFIFSYFHPCNDEKSRLLPI